MMPIKINESLAFHCTKYVITTMLIFKVSIRFISRKSKKSFTNKAFTSLQMLLLMQKEIYIKYSWILILQFDLWPLKPLMEPQSNLTHPIILKINRRYLGITRKIQLFYLSIFEIDKGKLSILPEINTF